RSISCVYSRCVHVFTTRRSSDLTRHEKIYPGDKIYAIGTDAQIENFNQYLNTEVSAGKLEEEKEVVLRQFLLGPESPLLHQTIRDRKSTRLNSSHVKNSYAVFCL